MQDLEPIEASIRATATPAQVFRMLTSQNELRRWWAPRVIMSRNIVGQEDDRTAEMRLIQSEKNHLVRYSWRIQDWPDESGATTITFRISDLGASRNRTGEGLLLEISHDGWTDPLERERQERIWKLALPVLESLLKGKEPRPWWEGESGRGSFRLVRLPALKGFVEKIEPDNRNRSNRRNLSQSLWKILSKLDGGGAWYLKEDESEFELRYGGKKVFGVTREGQATLHWKELGQLLGAELDDFARRAEAEQDLELNSSKTQEKVPAARLHPDFWIQWCQDVMRMAREKGHV